MAVGTKVLGPEGGTTAVAAYAVMMYSSDFCWPLLYGVSDSLAPSIGFNWGAGNYDRVKKIVKCGYIGSAVIGLTATFVLFFFSETVASFFVDGEDVRLLELSVGAIRLFCITYLVRWFVVTTQSFFSAIEKPVLATVMALSVALVFTVLFLGILWPLGLDGLWLNFVGVNFLAAVLALFLLRIVGREIKRKQSGAEQKKE
jgi:Na+-driven multidrug efflux pump